MTGKIIIDASNAPLGRLCSVAAKKALLGNSVVVVNCNNAVVSGRKRGVIDSYRESRMRGGSSLNGPHFPKNPERIVKRTIRGMLSYKEGRGRDAFGRIICYNDTPAEFIESKKLTLEKEFKVKTISLNNLSKEI
ncbi:MAG: 50S ribosomal protein L13 [Nanoarchaeota archaeon]|nr:50S ribosomal protein L13 [Nanoarchaeota archaeon]